MSIRKLFAVPDLSAPADLALLLLRVVSGLAFAIHGWGKIRDPFGWMGPDASVPGLFQALAALSEFGGGLAWMLGLLVPLASLGIAGTMVVAASMHAFVWGDPFVSTGGGAYELALVYLCVSFVLLALGPGRLSVDRALFGARAGA